jgi:hypothetical protein
MQVTNLCLLRFQYFIHNKRQVANFLNQVCQLNVGKNWTTVAASVSAMKYTDVIGSLFLLAILQGTHTYPGTEGLVEYPMSFSYGETVVIIWHKVWDIGIETPKCVCVAYTKCSFVTDCQVTVHFNCISIETIVWFFSILKQTSSYLAQKV